MKMLIATTNPGKITEIKGLLKGLNLTLLTLDDLAMNLKVEETGLTYAQNAVLKAQTYSQASGMVTLADDTGLEVVALGGAPGLHSARFSADPNAGDAERRKLLLEKLRPFPRPWTARFTCTVALATPQGQTQTADGACSGEIVDQERGTRGFGYDHIFLFPDLGKTMAELTLEEKNQVSHRARAVKAIYAEIEKLEN